jgi:hypothetical protein
MLKEWYMVCSKCGQELKDGVKFCTKCGASLTKANFTLPIISIVLSFIGSIGPIVILPFVIPYSDYDKLIQVHIVMTNFFPVLYHVGIIVALFALKSQKSFLAFIAGLISCVFHAIMGITGVGSNIALFFLGMNR